MENATERINEHLKKGNILITFNSMLRQDFETADGVLQKVSRRIGGGFTNGTTLHEVFENGISISDRTTLPSDNLPKIYEYFVNYCDKTFGDIG